MAAVIAAIDLPPIRLLIVAFAFDAFSTVLFTVPGFNTQLFDSTVMHLNSILILPAELIVNILKYTDYKTVIACRRVGLCLSRVSCQLP